MNAWEAVLLGLVQGLTEFLPISSSAHLRIVGELIGESDPGAAFTAITQIGTEAAVLLYFRHDIATICRAWWRAVSGKDGTDLRSRFGAHDPHARMAWFITIGSVPIGVLGLLFQDAIETSLRNLYITAFTLAFFGILLGWADRIGRKTRPLEDLTVGRAIAYGFAQALALIPGVSRSGGTITAGLLMGFTREAAARYSFLLAIPAVLASGLFQLVKSIAEPAQAGAPGAAATLVATLVAFVVGYFVIIVFLKIISTFSYMPFVYYRIGLAIVVVILLGTGVLVPLGSP
ncbi:undecaprenyl-diphosphate phosphatase [Paraoerskovia marina]|uniref:undecaprenyl-diphosphate phosphatase n=1 Tax=Paraoerskovia marina TaxID=545619 RepID=UPI000492CDC7|nr:undecaprenyl-diphosphate phosphatase [Paraoerskovia marina]